jgi:hypothetical protein
MELECEGMSFELRLEYLAHECCLQTVRQHKTKMSVHMWNALNTNFIQQTILNWGTLAVKIKIRAFWDIAPCSLGVDRRFRGVYCLHHQRDETSVYSNGITRCYIPEGSNLHTRRHENLKSHVTIKMLNIMEVKVECQIEIKNVSALKNEISNKCKACYRS